MATSDDRHGRLFLVAALMATMLAGAAFLWEPWNGVSAQPVNECAPVGRRLTPLVVDLAAGDPVAAGQVTSVSDGTLAALVVVTETADDAASRVNIAASFRIAGVVTLGEGDHRAYPLDPAARSVADLEGPDDGAITGVVSTLR